MSAIAGPLGFAAMLSAMLAVFCFRFLSIGRSLATPEELKAESSRSDALPYSDEACTADSDTPSANTWSPKRKGPHRLNREGEDSSTSRVGYDFTVNRLTPIVACALPAASVAYTYQR